MFRSYKVILIFLSILLLGSCGVSGRMPYKKAYSQMSDAMNSGDLYALVDLYYDFPEYEEYILSYIYNKFDYSTADYDYLSDILYSASQDSLLCNACKYLLLKKENSIDVKLRVMSIGQIGDYYRSAQGDVTYLDKSFSKNLTPVWESCDYFTLKEFHNVFSGTVWQDSVDIYYLPAKEVLLTEIADQLKQTYALEADLLDDMASQSKIDLTNYIQTATENLVQECFDRKMPLFKSNLKSRVDGMINEFYDENVIGNLVNTYTKDACRSLNNYRENLFQTCFPEKDQDIFDYSVSFNRFDYDSPYVPYSIFEELRKIQRQINWVSLGLTTASFLVVFPFDVVIDAADIAYSSAKEKAQISEIQNCLSKIAKSVSGIYLNDIDRKVSEYKNEVKKVLISNQDDIEQYIFENF